MIATLQHRHLAIAAAEAWCVAIQTVLARALHYERAARRDESNSFEYTAALQWRNAAELFGPDALAGEYCWRQWERIMQLPRRLAGPIGAFPSLS